MFTRAKPGTEKLEYRVRKVTRYVVTEWHQYDVLGSTNGNSGAGSSAYGEFSSASEAFKVAEALATQALKNLGWEEGDDRLIFPTRELVDEQREEYRNWHENSVPKPSDL